MKRFGEFLMPNKVEQLLADLDTKLFLEGRTEQAKQQALAAYRQAPSRSPQFAGRGYEADPAKLRAQINSFFVSKEGPEVKASHKGKLIKALVAPTYEMKQAGPIYAWAYKELQDAQKPDLYVLIGTAHSGLEHPVAVTDKDFQTPLGLVKVERAVTDRLREQIPAAFTDELAHHNEHALEFQLPFLQRDPRSRAGVYDCSDPHGVFCGQSARSANPGAGRDVSSDLKGRLPLAAKPYCVVVGAELAHIGMRYGDSAPPTDFSFHRCMQTDLGCSSMSRTATRKNSPSSSRKNDQRRISGFSPIYSMLRLIQAETGRCCGTIAGSRISIIRR